MVGESDRRRRAPRAAAPGTVAVNHGYCTSTQEAFSRFLGDGKPAAVARFDVTPEQAIELIHFALHGW